MGTRRLGKKSARPIFSVRICVASEHLAFARPSCIRSLFLLKGGTKGDRRDWFDRLIGLPDGPPLLWVMIGNCPRVFRLGLVDIVEK